MKTTFKANIFICASLLAFITAAVTLSSAADNAIIEPDHHELMNQLEKAAAAGDARSAAILSIHYRIGLFVQENPGKAFVYAIKAADAGDALGLFALGRCYGRGVGVKEDKQKEIDLITKARPGLDKSAQTNDPWAQITLASCWSEGIGSPKDARKTVEWLEKAAVQGFALAQDSLGYCFLKGQGVSKDESKAVEWFQKAAVQGFALAQETLGSCFAKGLGIGKDARKAVEWYEKAALQGYAPAQYSLGNCFFNGQGVGKDERKAVEWFEKAAAQGNANAQDNLGSCFAKGLGIGKDERKAVEWYEKATAQGLGIAQNNLGVCLAKGQGVGKDERKAVEWFEKAAAQGFAPAQNNLGVCLAKGQGVGQDESKAVEWYKKAAAQGEANAQAALASRGIKVTALSPTGSGGTAGGAPAVASSKETDCFDGKTLHGENREGPTVKGLQLGMHITEARDVLAQQAAKTLAMKFKIVKYDDGYGIRGTSTKSDKAGTVADGLEKLRDVSTNQAVSILNALATKINGGKVSYIPGADEVYVFAGQDGVVKGIGFPPFVVEKLFAEVSELPIAQFVEQYIKAYHMPSMALSFSENSEPIYQCVTKDGVVITVSQRMETMKAIEIIKKDVRGAKGFN